MTAFSSRGGPGQSSGVSKPDVTAPGLQILAANTPTPATAVGGPTGQLFQSIAGTSMSSPHVAGSGALLAALHPTWTPGQIKSALMTSATTDVLNNDGTSVTTPFDRGSGRIRLNKAGDPGATFDESAADYVALSEDLWNANYPSLYVPSLPGRITVERTLHNETNKSAKWKLSVSAPADLKVTVPSTLTLPPSGNATFAITVDGGGLADGAVRHAQITLSDSPGHRIVFPISIVRGQASIVMTKTCTPLTVAAGREHLLQHHGHELDVRRRAGRHHRRGPVAARRRRRLRHRWHARGQHRDLQRGRARHVAARRHHRARTQSRGRLPALGRCSGAISSLPAA